MSTLSPIDTVTLPEGSHSCVRRAAAAKRAARESPAPGHGQLGGRAAAARAQILIVEDSPSDALLVEMELTRAVPELAYRFAASVAGACLEASTEPPAVIVLDLALPDSTGIDTLERVRAAFAQIPVIVLTGRTDQALAIQALRLGAQDFVSKHDLSCLVPAVQNALHRAAPVPEGRAAPPRGSLEQLTSIAHLTAGMAHEINSPLQFIGDNLAFLRRAIELLLPGFEWRDGLSTDPPRALTPAKFAYLKAQVPAALAEAAEGVQRIAAIMRALKELSLESRGARVGVDLHQLIAASLLVFRSQWQREIRVVCSYARELPLVPAYPNHLGRALVNLLMNAAQNLLQAGGDAAISVQTSATAESVQVAISHDGPAIEPGQRASMFDPVLTAQSLERGTGHGLALVRAIVEEQHGGTLRVASGPAGGASIVVSLPLLC